jgi:Domain of unknown function (DUF4279)
VWGRNLDPEALTLQLEVEPSRSFLVGERAGRAAHEVAGWEWESEWSGWDIEPSVRRLIGLLGPHRAILKSCVDDGATARLVVAGEIDMDVVPTLAEADSRGYGFEAGEFAPFLDGDRVGLYFDSDALQFLADIGATLDTHIDIDLDDGKEGCS